MDYAFKPSTDSVKGISVVDLDCIESQNISFCEYIENFYPSFVSPTIGWIIPDNYLPEDHEITKDDEDDSDDPCHRNIINISANRSKKIFKKAWSNHDGDFVICDEENIRDLTTDDLNYYVKIAT